MHENREISSTPWSDDQGRSSKSEWENRFDESKMGDFPAGSFAYVDPVMHHYAMASGEVVVQIHSASPFQINYVNPDDDPSRKR